MNRRRMRFEDGYRFYTPLRMDTFNAGQDFLIAAITTEKPINAAYLGKIAEFDGLMGKDVWLDTTGAHVVYIIGKRRSGKSYLLGAIAEGLASPSLKIGDAEYATLILDTLNIYWSMELAPRGNDPQTLELQNWGLSPEAVTSMVCHYPRGYKQSYMPETYKEFAIKPSDLNANDWANLFEVDPIVDPMGQVLAEIYEKVAVDGYDTGTQSLPPNPNYSIGDLIQCLDNAIEIQRFPIQVREAVRRRLKSVERVPIFSSHGTDVRNLFKKNQVTVLLLRDLDPNLRGLVIGLLVRKIMQLRGAADEAEKRLELKLKQSSGTIADDEIAELKKSIEDGLPRGWILIDEAHNYIPQIGIIGSKEPLRRYVNEGRNIGLSIAVTTQQPSGLDSSIRRNADILFIHRVTMDTDLDATAAMLNTSVPDSIEIKRQSIKSRVFEHMVRELPLGYALVSCTNTNRIFMMKVRPRTSVHGGREY